MRNVLGALFGAIFFAILAAPAVAADRVVVYPMENPSSTDTNQTWRNQRIAQGNFWLNALGQSLASGGTYSDCSVVESTGLNVVVEPGNSNQWCTLYQLAEVDASSLPASLPSGVTGSVLSPDARLTEVDGEQSAVSSALGPLTAPGSGSVYWLIEAQVQATDLTAVTKNFFDASGNPFTASVSPTRSDVIVYQTVQGTPSSTPAEPSPDAGWIPIAYIKVNHGDTTITSISPAPAFNGFLTTGGGGNTFGGDQTITPNCTATSSTNCSSAGGWGLQNSLWSGSAAVTSTWKTFADSAGFFDVRYNNANQFSIDPSGDLTVFGNLASNANPLSLCGSTACANPVLVHSDGTITVPGQVNATNDVISSSNIMGVGGIFSAGVSGTTGTFSAGVSGTTGTFSSTVSGANGNFSGTVNANHLQSNDLGNNAPVCTDGSGDATTSGCGVPTSRSIGNSEVLCSASTGTNVIAPCSPSNWPAAGQAVCSSSSACDELPCVSSCTAWTSGSSCAAATICAACDLNTACGGSTGTPAGCFVRELTTATSQYGLIAYINRVGTSPTHTWIVWFNATGGSITVSQLSSEFNCLGG